MNVGSSGALVNVLARSGNNVDKGGDIDFMENISIWL